MTKKPPQPLVKFLNPGHPYYETAKIRVSRLREFFTHTGTPPVLPAEHESLLSRLEDKFTRERKIKMAERDELERIYKYHFREGEI